jgi:hypothetical protein
LASLIIDAHSTPSNAFVLQRYYYYYYYYYHHHHPNNNNNNNNKATVVVMIWPGYSAGVTVEFG